MSQPEGTIDSQILPDVSATGQTKTTEGHEQPRRLVTMVDSCFLKPTVPLNQTPTKSNLVDAEVYKEMLMATLMRPGIMNLQMEPVAPAAVKEYDVIIEQIYKNAMLVDAHILRFVCVYSDRLVKKALAAVEFAKHLKALKTKGEVYGHKDLQMMDNLAGNLRHFAAAVSQFAP